MENLIEKYPYLQYLERPLDNQQLQVCCRTDNTVVAAGAGSGKTQVLATRFAWLVMEHDEITAPSILTLTFTKKAAAEMYSRIYDTLKHFAYNCGDKIPERQRKNAEKALTEFANVHIQTLDSYCGGIVRQAANRYGIRPDFSAGTGDAKSVVKNLALPFILKHKDNKGVLYYTSPAKLQEFAENEFAGIISAHTTLATPANYFIDKLHLQSQEIVKAWNENIILVKDRINSIEKIFSENKSELVNGVTNYQKNLGPLELILNNETPEFNKFSDLESVFLQDSKVVNNMKTVVCYLEKWDSVKINAKLSNPIAIELRELVEPIKDKYKGFYKSLLGFVKDFPYSRELCLLLDEFLEQVKVSKRISGALEHADVSEMALKILIEQKDIRRQEKAAFNKIMIDEFQDNNGKNRDLLFLLSEAGDEMELPSDSNDPEALHNALKERIVKDKLFFVGDEKQSIYKFRGADVSVFNELKKDLEKINGKDSYLKMVFNYRSVPELLTSFNTMFGGHIIEDGDYKPSQVPSVFLHNSDDGFEALYPEEGIARYVDKTTHEPLPPIELTADNVKTHVEYFYMTSDFDMLEKTNQVLNDKNQIPYAIAKKIYELHTQNNVSYSDIAILEKGRGDRHYILSWLERFNIPYILDQQSNLFSDGPVNDVYNFFRLCVYPSDLKAFCAFICSPLVGLNEAQMEKIVSFMVEFKNPLYKFKAFNQDIESQIIEYYGKDSVVYERYYKAEQFYKENQIKVLSQPITETLNLLWYECGYRYETMLNNSVNVFDEQYDLLFELGHQVDEQGNGVAWFVDELANIQAKERGGFGSDDAELNAADISYPMERENAIKIMTIHKSKGLQFDYVFALGCMSKVKLDVSKSVYFDEEFGVCFKNEDGSGNYFFNSIKDKSDKKAEAEYRRLVYVATTRAVKELFLYGKMKFTAKGTIESSCNGVITPITSFFYPDFFANDVQSDYAKDAPFDVTKIEFAPASVYDDFGDSLSMDELRAKKIETATQWIPNRAVIETPVLESSRISPSSLEQEYNEELSAVLKKEQGDLKDLYPQIDAVVEKNAERFGFADFGTLVHFYLEETIKDVNPEEIKAHAVKLFRKIDEKYVQILDELCLKVCNEFMNTEVGAKIKAAKEDGRKVKAEHAFKSFRDGKIITGSIDLYYENADGTFTIIDYKTDHVINPEVYKEQQICYKEAVCNLFNLPEDKVNCQLYYIRFNLFSYVG